MKDRLYNINSTMDGFTGGVTVRIQIYLLADVKRCPDYQALEESVKMACMEYLQGKPEMPDKFQWLDFWADVPDEICEKYGFRKLSHCIDQTVDAGESLMIGADSQITDKGWDQLKSALKSKPSHLTTFLMRAGISYDSDKITEESYADDRLEKARKVRSPEALTACLVYETSGLDA